MDATVSSDSGPSVQQSPTTEQANLAVGWAKEFWQASLGIEEGLWYKFKRFEFLALLNLYLYQDELVKLQYEIDSSNGEMSIGQRTSLRALIKDYYEAMQLFKQTSQMKRPKMTEREKAIESLQGLTESYHHDHYRVAADALGMVDLTPQTLGVEPDAVRVILGGFSLFQSQATPLHFEEDPAASPVRPWLRPKPVSRITDNVARILMAVLTGILLLVPVIVLSYIKPKGYRLLATCLFVLAFAVIVSVGITATSNELVVATAAYAAVLVVFLGQTSPPQG